MQVQRALGHRAGQAAQRLSALGRHADVLQRVVGDRPRGGKQHLQPDRSLCQRLAETLHQAAGDGHRRLHRDLLADHRAHGLLERVVRRRQTQAGLCRDQRAECRVAGEMRRDRLWVGIQVEHLAHPGHQRSAGVPQRVAEGQLERRPVVRRAHTEPAAGITQAQRTGITARIQALYARQQTQREVAVELLPVPGFEVGQVDGFGHFQTLAPGRRFVAPKCAFKPSRFPLSSWPT